VALLALLTAACRIESNIGAEINADGSGVISAEIGYDEEAAGFIAQFAGGEDPFGDNPLANFPDAVISEEDRDGMHYRIYTADVDDIEAAIQGQMTAEENGFIEEFDITIAPTRVEVTGRGGASTALEGAEDFLSADELAESLSINLRLTLPGKILEHNADAKDGSTLTWAIPLAGTLDIHAVSDPTQSEGGGFPMWAIIVIAAVVVAGIAAIGLLGRKRRGAAVAPPPPPPAPPELPQA